jgi:hypothetical protein
LGLRVEGLEGSEHVSGLRVGFRVQGSGFRVQGLGFRVVEGLGFRVKGSGFRV